MAVVIILIIILIKTHLETRTAKEIKNPEEFKKEISCPIKIEHDDKKDGFYDQSFSVPPEMFDMPDDNNLVWRLCRIAIYNPSNTKTINKVEVQLTSINQHRLKNQTPLHLNFQHDKEKPYDFSTELQPNARKFVNVVMYEHLPGTNTKNYRIVSIEDSIITTLGVTDKDYKIKIEVTGNGVPKVEREFCFGMRNKDNTFNKIWLWPIDKSITEQEHNFKIKVHKIENGSITTRKNNKPVHCYYLKLTVTFIPIGVMEFKNLVLIIDDIKFNPTNNKLNLPFFIKNQETHEIEFMFEKHFLSDSNKTKGKLLAYAGGKNWESEDFDI